MGDVLIKAIAATALAFALPAAPAMALSGGAASSGAGASGGVALADDAEERLFTFRDPRITESSGLAVSPTHSGIYYTHNDSAAAPEFFAVDDAGRTKARYRVAGAQARDWEAMAATKDPRTGRGVLWFADIGDNLDGAWPDISIYMVNEPASLRDATVSAVRYRFRYEDGARNAEGIMVNPRTGRLSVVTKEFSGAVYVAPKTLRTGRVNILRKVGSAPIMATDAAYAPDGSSYVVRTYFSATLFRPSGEMISKVSMPQLDQAESIAFTPDGKALLTGSEGPGSPLYRVPLPERALTSATSEKASSPPPSAEKTDAEKATAVSATASDDRGLTGKDILIWLAAALAAIALITFIARRTR